MKSFNYSTEEERQRIIDENSGLFLILDESRFDGKTLYFDEVEPEPTKPKDVYIQELENELLLMEGGLL